jgi:hypothetical protein
MDRRPSGASLERREGKKGVDWRIERYPYRPIDAGDTLFLAMKEPQIAPTRPQQYRQLSKTLGRAGWISEGYVQDRGPGAGGPCYQWTRKLKGKTVSVALSREQYQWLKKAIENWRALQTTLKQMQHLSRQELFESIPGPPRRKRLSKKVLGTN